MIDVMIAIRVNDLSLFINLRNITPVELIPLLQQLLQSIHSQSPLEYLIALHVVPKTKFVSILQLEHVLPVFLQVVVA